ncbi:hypothetical protein IP86_15845 [Rhodopseudomonas sp. AAP120]|nr:hypothetical protein IP86_15845 [Rhodopseudomonas sp. AAP120]
MRIFFSERRLLSKDRDKRTTIRHEELIIDSNKLSPNMAKANARDYLMHIADNSRHSWMRITQQHFNS